MGYDCGDSFPLDFEPNGTGSKSKGKLSPRSYLIQCERKWECSFLSVKSLGGVSSIEIGCCPNLITVWSSSDKKYDPIEKAFGK